MVKGSVSNFIAWIFIVLQILLIMGGLYAGAHYPSQGQIISFKSVWAIYGSVIVILCFNILGVGALILSLIVWLNHKNLRGKTTTIVSAIVIIVNTLLLVLGFL
ncbi:MAG: hypothetical protein ACYSSP_10875 [Planctomycetota bacterium]|jgi:hypothetical protein